MRQPLWSGIALVLAQPKKKEDFYMTVRDIFHSPYFTYPYDQY